MGNEIVSIGKLPIVKSSLSVVRGLFSKFKSCVNMLTVKHGLFGQDCRQDGDVIDVVGVEVSTTTQSIIQALRERRFFDASDMLQRRDVDMGNSELLYLLAINTEVLSKFGIHNNDSRRLILRSAQKGFVPAQMDMYCWSLGQLCSTEHYYDEEFCEAYAKPLMWLEMAAGTSGDAAYRIAKAYEIGQYVGPRGECLGFEKGTNLLLARKWYEKAAALGCAEAESDLSRLINTYNS